MPPDSLERQWAQHYRDGLMIAFLSCHPERAANFAGLELGRHLTRSGEGWWLAIEGSEVKNGRPVWKPVQQRLVPMIERYLRVWRPRLASPDRVARSRAMWLTREGTAISTYHLHTRITRHTREAFGKAVWPHLFRDAVATTVALTASDEVGILTPLLNHGSLDTAQQHYNQAGMTSAAKAWHEVLRELEGP